MQLPRISILSKCVITSGHTACLPCLTKSTSGSIATPRREVSFVLHATVLSRNNDRLKHPAALWVVSNLPQRALRLARYLDRTKSPIHGASELTQAIYNYSAWRFQGQSGIATLTSMALRSNILNVNTHRLCLRIYPLERVLVDYK